MVLDADNSPTVLADSVELTAMTNQELQIKVAKAMGLEVMPWLGVFTEYEGGPDLECPVDEYPGDLETLHGFMAPVYLVCIGLHGYDEAALTYGHEQWCYKPIPNWPEDLPACMQDLWPWLAEQVRPWGGSVVLEIILAPPQSYGEGAIDYRCAAYTYPDDFLGEGLGEKGGAAICHAVLAVKEKLTE